jgi:hypothetical protein
MIGEAEIIIATERNNLAAVDHHFRAGRGFGDSSAPVQMLSVPGFEFCTQVFHKKLFLAEHTKNTRVEKKKYFSQSSQRTPRLKDIKNLSHGGTENTKVKKLSKR